MLLNNVQVTVLVKNQPIMEYQSNELPPRTFVEGRPGSCYELQICNHTPDQIEVIVSVDGLAVTDGKPAADDSLGFIVAGRNLIRIPGWLLDHTQAAQFTFGKKARSYAALNGHTPHNVGVIGVRAFADVTRRHFTGWYIPALANGHSSQFVGSGYTAYGVSTSATPGLSSSNGMLRSMSQNLGTAFGAPTEFRTTTTQFTRGPALGTLLIYYDDRKGLKTRGIGLDRRPAPDPVPEAFPGMRGCVPPPDWPA